MKRWCLVTLMLLAGLLGAIALVFSTQHGYVADARELDGTLLNELIRPQLQLGDRPALGQSDSPLQIVEVVDFNNKASEAQYKALLPFLQKNYLTNGTARLYHKYILTAEEYKQKKGRFKYAAAALCLPEQNESVHFHELLFETSEEKLPVITRRYGINLTRCLQTSAKMLRTDMLETKLLRIMAPSIRLSIDGRDETILLGDPSVQRVKKSLRNKEVLLGQ